MFANQTKRLTWWLRPTGAKISAQDAAAARQYIKDFWPKLYRDRPDDDETLIGLPYPYLVPAYEEDHTFDFNEMYYWDSYFMIQGLLDEEHRELALGILDNLCFMMQKYHVIPNASRTYLMGRSQPPLLTSFIFDLYDTFRLSKWWLKTHMAVAELEYRTVWTGIAKPHWRQVYQGLNRYYDINMIDNLAETESGWDMTPRFNRHCLNYLPIDLNALLYKYELDFARAAELLGQNAWATKWKTTATERKVTINKLMWSDIHGLYYDYNFVKKRRGNVNSLAAYVPMWAGMVSDKQAAQLVHSLWRFENRGGLSVTDEQLFSNPLGTPVPTQWAYPNGWAPLHFFVVKGLQRYGYQREARRIAHRWLKTNLDWFNKHGVFLEKYNVVQPGKPPAKGLYPSQTGFGWTNALFERFCQEFMEP